MKKKKCLIMHSQQTVFSLFFNFIIIIIFCMERNVYKRLTSDYVKIFHHFTEIKKKKKLQHTIKLKSDFKIKLLLTFYPS